jgi:outer membrane protein assembly factor BamB
VYVHFGNVGVFCLDLAGKVLWKRDLGVYPMVVGFGTGGSPVLHGDKLLVLRDNEAKSFLVALNKRTGEPVWRVERPGKTSWSTPFVWTANGRTQVVCCGDKAVTAYDPDSGSQLWTLGGIDSSFSTSPAADADRIYFGTGGPGSAGPIYAVKATATGDITLAKGETANAGVAWSRTKSGLAYASPLVLDGRLYLPGRGAVTCLDAATGKPHYEGERLPKAKSITSSPWAAGGVVYFLDEAGRAFAVAAGPEFKVVGEGTIEEMCWATPAVADGAVYVRGRDKLYCVAGK